MRARVNRASCFLAESHWYVARDINTGEQLVGKDQTSDSRTTAQRLRDGATKSAALGATITVVGGMLLVNGQPASAGDPSVNLRVVTTLEDEQSDNGLVSLREAIDQANDDADLDQITFDPSLFDFADGAVGSGGEELALTDGAIRVSHAIHLTGPGADMLTITGESGGLYIYGGTEIEISALTIDTADTAVRASEGDGFEPYIGELGEQAPVPSTIGPITLTDVALRSVGTSALIASNTSGDVTVSGSEITGDSDGPYSRGAAIDLYEVGAVAITNTGIVAAPGMIGLSVDYADSLTVTDVSITEAEAEAEPAFDIRRGPSGGGIDTSYVGLIDISGSTISNTTGVGIRAGDGPYSGKALALSIDDTTISGNSGGAVQASTYIGTTITNSTISGNSTVGGFGPGGQAIVSAVGANFGDRADSGDSVDGPPEPGPALTVVNSTISGNSVGVFGSVISTSDGGGFERYLASADAFLGGAPGLVLANSTVVGNVQVIADNPYECNDICAPGDDVPPSFVLSSGSGVVIDHSIVTANGDLELEGGGDFLYVEKDASADSFGGFTSINAEHAILPTAFLDQIFQPQTAVGPGGEPVILPPGFETVIFSDEPGLGDLADNGGSTLTHRPEATSPAVDSGDEEAALFPSGPESLDQRGALRVSGSDIDVGSVELITDDVTLVVSPAIVAEADGKTVITVTRSGAGEGAASVQLSTSTGTAGDDDFTALDQMVEWAEGETGAKTIDLLVATDDAVEEAETLIVEVDDELNLNIDTDSVEVTITDSTTPPDTTPTTTPTTVPETTTPPTTAPPTTAPPTTTAQNSPPAITPGVQAPVSAGKDSVIVVIIEDSEDDDLEVMVTSSDPSLLEVLKVEKSAVNGNQLTRTSYDVTVRAAIGGSGTAQLIVTADDGTSTSTQNIDVEVSNAVLPSTGSDGPERTGFIAALLVAVGGAFTFLGRRRRLS